MQKYFKHKIEKLIVIDKIVTIHYFEFSKNFKADGEAHNFWEIVYVDEESVICTADEKSITLNKGEILFHKPDEYHTLSANGIKSPKVFIISFECKSPAMRFFEDKKISVKQSEVKFIYNILEEAKKTFDIPFSNPKMKKLSLAETPTLGGEQLIKNYLEIMLISIMRSLTETPQGNPIFLQSKEFKNKLVRDLIAILKENVNNTLNVDEICNRVNYSRAYIFKIFQAATGKGLMEYFIALKIEKAKKLLLENELSVKEISEILAFDTPNYFSKTFKKLTGLTPTTYKKRAY